jgi:thioredoxin-dependent peroxiredoxin
MTLVVGDAAPDFTVPDGDGNAVSLSQFHGKTVVLYFYPRDNTPGCTKEACGFRDNWAALQERGVVVLGVSTDTQASHRKFTTKFTLPFPLLSDENKELSQLYGVWGEKKFMGKTFLGIKRSTFVIAPDGTIQHIFTKVNTDTHATDILKLLIP